MKAKVKSLFLTGFPVALTAFFLVVVFAWAWVEPIQGPPNGNVPAPINVGPSSQTKEGPLALNVAGINATGLFVNNDAYFMGGNIGIGTTTPSELLHVYSPSNHSLVKIDSDSATATAGLLLHNDLSPSLETTGIFLGGSSNLSYPNSLVIDNTLGPTVFVQGPTQTEVMRITTGEKVGIGTTVPELKLSLDNDGGIIAKGTFNSGDTLTTSGPGVRLIWYPRKGAFRAGGIGSGAVPADHWDEANIGDYSAAVGYNNKASGNYSAAMGCCNTVSGGYSTVMGLANTASGFFSTAMGEGTTASDDFSTAMGQGTTASGYISTAMGKGTTASGAISTAMGEGTTASGVGSTAMGEFTRAQALASVAIGRYNVGGGTSNSWVATDPLFEIGIGTSAARANALTVLKNGNVGIDTTTPSEKLEVNGNAKIGGDLEVSGGDIIIGQNEITWSPGGYNTGFRIFSRVGADWLGYHGQPLIFENGTDLKFEDNNDLLVGTIDAYEGELRLIANDVRVGYGGLGAGNLHVQGKITATGGIDPSYVAFEMETRKNIIEKVAKEIPEEKLNQAIQFWNEETSQFEVYLPTKGEFRDLQGNLLEKVGK